MTHPDRSSSKVHAPQSMAPGRGCPQRSPSQLLEVLLAHIPECLQVRLVVLLVVLQPPPQDLRRQRSTPAQAETGRHICLENYTNIRQKEIKTHLGASRLW